KCDRSSLPWPSHSNLFQARVVGSSSTTIVQVVCHQFVYCRTLVGSGLRHKSVFRRPLASLVPDYITYIPEHVDSFSPSSSSISTTTGCAITYDTLVVATGLQINWNAIDGLPKALVDPSSGVSSIYSYNTCDKVWSDIEGLRSGNAIFTQPAGIVKCAGGE